jgi:hypothetical protein
MKRNLYTGALVSLLIATIVATTGHLIEKSQDPTEDEDPDETPEAKRKLLKKNPVLAKHKASKDNKAELAKNFLNKQRRKQK